MLGQKNLSHRIKDDRYPPWRENGLKKRAKAMDTTAPPCKNGKSPGCLARKIHICCESDYNENIILKEMGFPLEAS